MLTLVSLLNIDSRLNCLGWNQPASHGTPSVTIWGRPGPITWALPGHFAARSFAMSVYSVFARNLDRLKDRRTWRNMAVPRWHHLAQRLWNADSRRNRQAACNFVRIETASITMSRRWDSVASFLIISCNFGMYEYVRKHSFPCK